MFPEGTKGGAQAAGATEDEITPARLDLRIGKILSVEKVISPFNLFANLSWNSVFGDADHLSFC